MSSEDRHLEDLKKIIFEEGGFDPSPYSKKFLKRKIRNRMRKHDIDSFRKYANFLEESPSECSILIDAISIPVTEFFRDREVWDDFEDIVLEELISDKKDKGQKLVRVWSAGCASGEETYSIIMSIKEFLGSNFDELNVRVYGTDIDDEALSKARKGVYTEEEVENVPKKFLKKYFEPDDGKYRVKKTLKRNLKFKKHNLIDGPEFNNFDVIFCRNMVIYFSKDSHQIVHNRLYESLNDSGFLIIGKTEILHGKAREKLKRVTKNRIYKKPSTFPSRD
ncbi:hypothetical protein AKJ51_02340 [candidate division MSBL1 archaeon SCGC-AAA382A20]|uniref:protein-glutamate O-methyltransferase n=1 Tax=candidate division MSBL1 archaeon SCGC-AAA382A20 TaxID=1698280 RepID=A0A133VKQ1_9EURY|nr:hypothetical protein AKJ51_02340 [candidate division MSBL1 archaeon SCGC-AAA382A20]